MDNITHTLIGAVLGQAGLKRRTGLAMPALMIAANLPDIDAPCALYGVESLAMRRGLSHGPIALVVLPLLLWGGLLWFDRWQARRGTRPAGRDPLHPGWLLALCYIGTMTHPAFDWLNNYGIRLLEPFSHRWFYGDALFIVDPWILVMLGLGIWLSRRRERAGAAAWAGPSRLAIGGVLAYVGLNLAISGYAEKHVAQAITDPRLFRDPAAGDVLVVANAVPFTFWNREVLWRDGKYAGTARFSMIGLHFDIPASHKKLHSCPEQGPCGSYVSKVPWLDKRVIDADYIRRLAGNHADPQVQAFLFWSRMPIVDWSGRRGVLKDQRFMQAVGRGNFSVELKRE